jgi:hypothetical protein
MKKKKTWLVFGMVVCIFVVGALACVFPAKLTITDGLLPSSDGKGSATLNTKNVGCDCESDHVSGELTYHEFKKNGKISVAFSGIIDHNTEPGCVVPEDPNLWATGTYVPDNAQGTFSIALFGKNDPIYKNSEIAQTNCDACQNACSGTNIEGCCWRLWLEGGAYDGYENWACKLENEEDSFTYEEHPPDSDCGSN